MGIIQSPPVTCKLHALDPYTYLVDFSNASVRIPSGVSSSWTPWVWKSLFARVLLRSALCTHDAFPH